MNVQEMFSQALGVFNKRIADKSMMHGEALKTVKVYRGSWFMKWLTVIMGMVIIPELVLSVLAIVGLSVDFVNDQKLFALFKLVNDEVDLFTIVWVSTLIYAGVMYVYAKTKIEKLWGLENFSSISELRNAFYIIAGAGFIEIVCSGLVICVGVSYLYKTGPLSITLYVIGYLIYVLAVCGISLLIIGIANCVCEKLGKDGNFKHCFYTGGKLSIIGRRNEYVDAKTGLTISKKKQDGTVYEEKINLTKCGVYALGKDKIVIDASKCTTVLDSSMYDVIRVKQWGGQEIEYRYENGKMMDQAQLQQPILNTSATVTP